MKAIDELRNEICVLRNHYNIDTNKLVRIADAIERELEEEYVPLPKDADGVPIHIGDEVYENENYHERMSFMWLTEEGWVPCCFDCACESLHHYNPHTVEDVLWELLGSIRPEMEDDEAVPIVRGFAERLQLLEGE